MNTVPTPPLEKDENTLVDDSPKIILDYFRVELNRLEKERHDIIDEYLEVLRLKKIEVLEKSLGI